MKKGEEWYNNDIGKRFNKDYPRTFSLCDMDGITRCGYKDSTSNKHEDRLIIYESKHIGEKAKTNEFVQVTKKTEISQPQFDTLCLLKSIIDWSKLDNKSGVYAIIHDNKVKNLKLYDIDKNWNKGQWDRKCDLTKEITMDEFYNLVSAAKLRDKINAK